MNLVPHHISSVILFLFLALPSALNAQQTPSQLKLRTVVLDPGHGGKDAECVSRDGKTYEKTLTLSVAKLLGQKISSAYPDVKVVYTRSTDQYITLNDRAEIANRNHADLFISIHIDAFTNTSANGFSAHVFGRSSGKDSDLFQRNLDLCRRENSVILLEEDYSTEYSGFDPNDPESFIFFNLMQNAFYEQSILFAAEVEGELSRGPIAHSRGIWQNPFYVLWRTTMPAVLVELGFMSNPSDLSVLKSTSGKEQIATRLFNAFRKFKTKYDGSVDLSSAQAVPEQKSAAAAGPSVQQKKDAEYGIQILVLSKRLKKGDKALKGYSPEIFPAGKVYKYVVGISSSEKEMMDTYRAVKRRFPDSFPVVIEGGTVSALK